MGREGERRKTLMNDLK